MSTQTKGDQRTVLKNAALLISSGILGLLIGVTMSAITLTMFETQDDPEPYQPPPNFCPFDSVPAYNADAGWWVCIEDDGSLAPQEHWNE